MPLSSGKPPGLGEAELRSRGTHQPHSALVFSSSATLGSGCASLSLLLCKSQSKAMLSICGEHKAWAGFSFMYMFNKLQSGTLWVTDRVLWAEAKLHRSCLRGAYSLEEDREDKQVHTQKKIDAGSGECYSDRSAGNVLEQQSPLEPSVRMEMFCIC